MNMQKVEKIDEETNLACLWARAEIRTNRCMDSADAEGELFDHFLRLIHASIRDANQQTILRTFADWAEMATGPTPEAL